MTTTPTPDPLAALAAELGRIGQRLDGMGVELLALRNTGSAARWSAPPAAAVPPLPPGGAAASWYGPPVGAAGPSPWPMPVGAAGPSPLAPPVGAAGPSPWPPSVGAAVRSPWPPQATPPAGLGPAPGWPPAGWADPERPYAGTPLAGTAPAGPPQTARGATAAGAPQRSPLTGARLLAWTGGAVTLLGVVLLLALAASRGWFTPPARVAFGAVLGAGLVGLGAWLHRRESARAGALALVATGFATLYLVDAAATAIFGYLPALPALLLALVIAGAGLGLADRWRTQVLAGGVVVGAAVLAPALADGWLLVALVLVLQLAAVLVVLRRRWAVLMLLAAAGPVLYGMYAVAAEEAVLAVVGVAAAVLLVALATAALALRRIPAASAPASDGRRALPGGGAQSVSSPAAEGRMTVPGSTAQAMSSAPPAAGGRKAIPGDTPAAERPQIPGADPATGRSARTWVGAIAAVVAAAVLPALVAAPTLGGWRGALLAGGAAAALAVLVGLPGARPVKVAAGVAAVTALLTATVVGLDGAPAVLAVLGEALVAALVAVGLRSRFAMITALVLGGMAWIAAVQRDAPITTLVRFTVAPTVPELVTAVAASALIVALAAALLVAGGRLGWIRPDASRAAIWVPIGLVWLYGAAGVIVNAALLVSPTSTGFTAGHAVVTVSWTVGALVLLARGLRRQALRIAGLVLVAAAVAKLVLFDLVALDGLARVIAFLGAGLVLLAAGTRYARLVAEAEQPPSE